jgi:act minimal PKS ketosynthase (KS/KS alpha)
VSDPEKGTVVTAGAAPRNPAIAITGIGVLTPLGDSLASLVASLHEGRRAVAPAAELDGAGESRIADFEATRYTNVRGMRIYNRTTRLGICAAKLALADAGLESGPPGSSAAGAGPASTGSSGAGPASTELGMILASTFGHLDTLIEYDRSLVTEGIQRTNPALMPLGLPSAPGAAIALAFGAKAFSITLGDDGVSSLDALGLGARLLREGRARVCVVVGVFSPFLELSLAALHAGLLAPAQDFRVFDRRHRGTALGEAAAAVTLERLPDARERGAPAKGFLCGQASRWSSKATPTGGSAAGMQRALQNACQGALAEARIDAAGVSLVSAGANGAPEMDRVEACALLGTLGASAEGTPVMAVKANLGDGIDAGGLVQAVVALSVLGSGKAPPIPELDGADVQGLAYARADSAVAPGHALVTSTSSTGSCSALILSVNHGNDDD